MFGAAQEESFVNTSLKDIFEALAGRRAKGEISRKCPALALNCVPATSAVEV